MNKYMRSLDLRELRAKCAVATHGRDVPPDVWRAATVNRRLLQEAMMMFGADEARRLKMSGTRPPWVGRAGLTGSCYDLHDGGIGRGIYETYGRGS